MTADDVGTLLSVDCIPMDESGRQVSCYICFNYFIITKLLKSYPRITRLGLKAHNTVSFNTIMLLLVFFF